MNNTEYIYLRQFRYRLLINQSIKPVYRNRRSYTPAIFVVFKHFLFVFVVLIESSLNARVILAVFKCFYSFQNGNGKVMNLLICELI